MRVRGLDVGLFLALAGSVALNLWPRRSTAPTPGPGPVATAPSTPAGKVVRVRRSPVAAPSQGDCGARLAELRASLATLDQITRELAAQAVDEDAFAAAPENHKLAEQLRAQFSRLVASGRRAFADLTVECRADVCRVSRADAEGARVFAELREEAWVRTRVKHGQWGQGIAFWRLRDEPLADGRALLADLVARFRRSGAMEDCQRRHAGTGELLARLELRDDVAPTEGPPLLLTVGGSLAGAPLGACIWTALRVYTDTPRLPPQFTPAELLLRLPERKPVAPAEPPPEPVGAVNPPLKGGGRYD